MEDDILQERWYQRYWRPCMAFLYMGLCILDYAIRPTVNYYQVKQLDLPVIVQTIKGLDAPAQVQVLQTSQQSIIMPPILNEFVHVAFGTVLGIAAFTRLQEKQVQQQQMAQKRNQ